MQAQHTGETDCFSFEIYHRYVTQRQFTTAFRYLQPAVAADPMNPDLLEAVSDCYWHLNRPEQSLHVLNLMYEHWPDRTSSGLRLAARQGTLGNTDASAAVFRQLYQARPDCAEALLGICGHTMPALDSPEAEALETLSQDRNRPLETRSAALTLLGKLASRTDTHRAFERFEAANRLLPGSHDTGKIDRRVNSQVASYANLSATGNPAAGDTRSFSFVVGPARSGTTLLETMLLRHPEIQSIGESQALQRAFYDCRSASADLASVENVHAWTQRASPSLLAQGRRTYFAEARLPQLSQTDATPSHILSKMPTDSFYLGFAQMILPGFRAIFMLRHPLDVGLSMFCTPFAERHPYTRRLDWIGHMLRATYRSLDDYSEKLGDRLRLQSYRALVTQPEAQMRQILSFLDLPWHQDCLHPEQTEKAILTASSTQVRQGLNQHGLDKWRRFEAELSPLVDALGGWDWITAWEERDAALQER